MSAGRQSVLVFGFSICLAFFKGPEPWKAATGTACGVLKALRKALMSGSTLQSIEQQKVKLILSQGGCLFNLLATTWKEFRTSSMQGRFILCFLTWMVPDQFRCWPWSSKVWTIFVILFWGATTLMTWRRLQKTWAMNALLQVVRSWGCWSGCMLSSIPKTHLQKSLLEAWWKLLLLCKAKCSQLHQHYHITSKLHLATIFLKHAPGICGGRLFVTCGQASSDIERDCNRMCVTDAGRRLTLPCNDRWRSGFLDSTRSLGVAILAVGGIWHLTSEGCQIFIKFSLYSEVQLGRTIGKPQGVKSRESFCISGRGFEHALP